MIICEGRSLETVRMKNKPIPAVFKMWAAFEAGYVINFFEHSNHFQWKYLQKYKGKLMHASSIVAYLLECLPGRNGDCLYHVFMDILFSSLALFANERKLKIACTGTTRANRKGFPDDLNVRGGADKFTEWDTLGGCDISDDNQDVLAFVWIDNYAVQMLTTGYKISADHKVERLRRRPRITPTNGPNVRAVSRSDATKKASHSFCHRQLQSSYCGSAA